MQTDTALSEFGTSRTNHVEHDERTPLNVTVHIKPVPDYLDFG